MTESKPEHDRYIIIDTNNISEDQLDWIKCDLADYGIPTTSLDRLIAEKQAEELEEIAAQIGILKPGQVSPVGFAVSLRMRAKDKRKQAKEGT